MADAIDDGLIKALEPFSRAYENEGDGDSFEDRHSLWEHPAAMDLTVGDLRRARQAISRHKAPLSVRDQVERDKEAFASLSPGEQQAAREELHSIGQNPGVEFAPLSVAGDDVERLREKLIAFVQQPKWRDDAAEPEDNPDWRSGYEAALSNLREELKPWWPFGGPLRLTALQVTEGDKVERLVIAARNVVFSGLFDGRDEDQRTALRELDQASEAFASCIPWEDEPHA